MHQLKNFIRKLIPEVILIQYHLALAKIAALVNGYPANKLFVIGITGTKGKTSSANFVWSVLTAGGFKTGQLGTANIRLGDKDVLNNLHMTMPGPFKLQRILRQMRENGCTHVVLEATSEGLKLMRHIGITFDAAIFTNLSPEHLSSHGGSFEKYKQAKGKLFNSLMEHAKQLEGKYVKRISIVNNDDDNAKFFAQFPADIKKSFGIKNIADVQATRITDSNSGVDFDAQGERFHLSVIGRFNIYNALPAIVLGEILGIPLEKIKLGLANLKVIEGRMQKIDAGQKFTVIVDYAHENTSLNAALDAARNIAENHNIIALIGGQGGGRDKSKRSLMGASAAKKAEFVIVANEDPYDDDPAEIIEQITKAAEENGKTRNLNLYPIMDRREGIAKAFSLAQAEDVVLITGKGAEQNMVVKNKMIPWDDRVVAKEELKKIINN